MAMFLVLVIVNDLASGIDTSPAAAADGQLHLNLTQGARALVDGATDLTIRNSEADADVHGEAWTLPADRC
jgi:hypothetical protein